MYICNEIHWNMYLVSFDRHIVDLCGESRGLILSSVKSSPHVRLTALLSYGRNKVIHESQNFIISQDKCVNIEHSKNA